MAQSRVRAERKAAAVGRLDRWLTALLRFDLSRRDVVKWVGFARSLFALMLVSIVLLAGFSATLATRQASGLLHDSLDLQGRAIAASLARSAFVPMTLENRAALEKLLAGQSEVPDLAGARVLDAGGGVVAAFGPPAASGLVVRAPIVPVGYAREQGLGPAIGSVEVAMSTSRVDAKSRAIAVANVAISALLALLFSGVGFLVLRHLVERMRELVGEARLVDEVKAVNSELESFSYSVAHDLRAPLRHVSGFIDMLRRRSAGALDDKSRRYLDKIDAAARRMGEMIDDLLQFSRLGRAPLRTGPVDLGAVVGAVVEDFAQDCADREVEWRVSPLPGVDGDASMLRYVFANLIGNALKYSSKRPKAVVEIGAREEERRRVFFVKDNGAGFDMRYVSKLFGVFQRLHLDEEFEGNGIGLANVRRIVQKHGGEAWAEGAVDRGATFYFSIPKPRNERRKKHGEPA